MGTIGELGNERNELMGIGEMVGVGSRVLECEDVGAEVMDR